MKYEKRLVPLALLGAYVLLTFAAFWIGDHYVAAWLPLLKNETQWLLPRGLLCDSLSLLTRNAERLIEVHAVTTMQMPFDASVLPAGVRLKTSTLQAYLLSHVVIVYAILVAWPVTHWRGRVALLLSGVPCVFLTTSLDIPFVLAGLAQNLILGQFAPERASGDPLVLYYSFMHGGGRVALAICGALLTGLVVTRFQSRAPETDVGRRVNSSAQKRHDVEATAR